MSRCENCGNHGVRNNEYCDCSYGSQAKIRNGDYKLSPDFQLALDRVLKDHNEAFKRLAQH